MLFHLFLQNLPLDKLSKMHLILAENENYFNNRIGGISSYIKALILQSRKSEITCICIGSGFEKDRQINNVNYLSVSRINITNTLFFFRLFFFRMKNIQDKERIFHLHHPYMIFPFLKYLRQSKYILTLHSKQNISFQSKRNKLTAFVYNFITRKSLRYYNHIIADNQELLNYFHSNFGFDISQSSVISPPVDLDVFKSLNRNALRQKKNLTDTDKLILFAGRVEKEKNLELLISSYRLLLYGMETIKLWIIGEGSELKRIQNYTNQLGLLNVSFINTVSRSELAELMNCADVFALTSLHEGGPIVVKEALACNLAVVSVDVGDVANLITGLEGCFISDTNETDFAECLRKAIEHKSNTNYRDAVLQYGVEEFGESVFQIYKRVENN